MLAFACAFTMFAGAAFTDAADIKTGAAVDMLSALGVINGYKDGSFKPDATITRAEAAKMIYTIRNGGNDNADTFKGKSKFADVYNGHWAEGYINFCYTNGIINGKSATKFAPEDSVTGTELAKMLLICMGYQAEKSGLTGTGYSQRTNALASQNGLLDDVTAAMGAAFPRQYAAQMMYNALDADTVQWSTDINDYEKVKTTALEFKYNPGSTTDGSWVSVSKNETMGKKWMGLDTKEDIQLTSVEKESGKDTYNLNDGMFTKVATDYSNLLGQVVKVMVKDDDTSKVYGVYADEDSKVLATGYVGQLEKDGSEKIKLNGTSYKLDSGEPTKDKILYANVAPSDKNADTYITGYDTLYKQVEKGAVVKNVAAAPIKLIDNDGDGKVDAAVYTPVKVGKVTSVSKSAVTVNNGINTVKFDDADIYDGIAKDDYVMFVDEENRSSDDKDALTKLDVTASKVTGTRSTNSKTSEIKVDGAWVKLANDLSDTPESGSTYDMVIVGGVVLFAEETQASSKDILYISGTKDFDNYTGEATGTKEVRAYFADGTNKTVKVSKYDGDKIAADDEAGSNYAKQSLVAKNKMYTYSVLSDNTYDIKAVSETNRAGYDSYKTATNAYKDQKIDGKAPTDDAVVFVQTKTETKVLTGKQIKNWADSIDSASFASTYLLNEKNGINYVAAATLIDTNYNEDVPGATKDTLYGYLTADAYKGDKDGEDKATYEVWTNEGSKTLYADTSSVVGGAQAGAVISYNVNGSYIENIKVNGDIKDTFAEVAITGFDYAVEGELRFVSTKAAGVLVKGFNQYTLDEDCVFIGVNDEDTKGAEGTGMEQIQFANAGDHSTSSNETVMTNAYIVMGGDKHDKVVAIIFDAENNELDAAKEIVKATGVEYGK